MAMTLLDELRQKVEISAKNFRNELISRKEVDSVLPVDDIEVIVDGDGVVVHFFKSESKKAKGKPKMATAADQKVADAASANQKIPADK